MTERKKLIALSLFTLLFTFGYYAWITIWNNNPDLASAGGSFFSGAGILITVVWLTVATKRSSGERRIFWALLALGTYSYMIGETVWLYQSVTLDALPPSPGLTDFFFVLQIVLYLGAFIYPFTRLERNYRVFRLLFDVLIVMTVATTFSWQFLIGPLLNAEEANIMQIAVSLAYPIGDLVLLFGAVSLYWGARQVFADKLVVLVVGGLVVHSVANSVYLYLVSLNNYSMGSLIDPVFTLSLLLIGCAGALQKKGGAQQLAAEPQEKILKQTQQFDLVRIAFPYASVIVLFFFMVVDSGGIGTLTIGCGLSILLVIARQMTIMLENQRLLKNLYDKTEELEVGEQRYRSLFDYHPDAVYSLDLNGNFQSVNSACADLLGCSGEELIGVPYSSFLNDPSSSEVWNNLHRLQKGKSIRHEATVRNQAGRLYEVSITSIPIRVKNKVVGFFGIGRDITANKQNEEKIWHLAYHDPLTNLANRTSFDEALKQAVYDAGSRQEELAVVFIDLDGFKSVNDTLGHDVGDKLLVSVADRLRACMRKGDMIARQGGDEFTLLFQGITGIEDVKSRAQRVLDELSLPHDIDGRLVLGTPSIGIACYPTDHTTPVGLMKKADIALYQVKDAGKGHYRLFRDSDPWVFDKISLEKDITESISRSELLLHYEPQIDPDTDLVTGVEAQLRWNRPGFGLLEPETFLSAAVETGMMLKIGEWMLREACTQSKSWQDAGFPLKVTVNLSLQQLGQDSLPERLKRILEETGASPGLLELELTEASFIQHAKNLVPRLHALKELGVSLSVDGCGARYAALFELENLPIDTLKLDAELVRHIGSSGVLQSVAASIAALAKVLHIRVAAEGVENEAQASALRNLARFGIQGSLLGGAVPPGEIGSLPRLAPGS